MATSSARPYTLACQCGSISFPIPHSSPLDVYICHCTECQRQSSSAFGISVIFPAFDPPAGVLSKIGMWTRDTETGNAMDCYFCKTCGVRLFHRIKDRAEGGEEHARPTVSVKGGAIRNFEIRAEEVKHIWTRSAVMPIPEGVRRWSRSPEQMVGRYGKEGES